MNRSLKGRRSLNRTRSLKGKKKIKIRMSKRERKRRHIGEHSKITQTLNKLRQEEEDARDEIIRDRIQRFNLPRITPEQYNKLKYLLIAYGVPGLTYILQQLAESKLSYEEWYSIYGLGVGMQPYSYKENEIRLAQSTFPLTPLKF